MAPASGWAEQRFVGFGWLLLHPLLPQLPPTIPLDSILNLSPLLLLTLFFSQSISLFLSLPPSIMLSHTYQLLHPQPPLQATCSIHTLIAVCWTREGFALFSPNKEGMRGWWGNGCFQALHSDVTVIQTNVMIQCGLLYNKASITLQPGSLKTEVCQNKMSRCSIPLTGTAQIFKPMLSGASCATANSFCLAKRRGWSQYTGCMTDVIMFHTEERRSEREVWGHFASSGKSAWYVCSYQNMLPHSEVQSILYYINYTGIVGSNVCEFLEFIATAQKKVRNGKKNGSKQ